MQLPRRVAVLSLPWGRAGTAVLAVLFVASRLPGLAVGWHEGEPSFLVGAWGSPAAVAGRELVRALGEPYEAHGARLLGLLLGTATLLALGRVTRRLVGRRTGPPTELVLLGLLTGCLALDAWMTDVRHLGDLACLLALAVGAERLLTWKLRAGPWRLALALAALALASASTALAWVAGPFLAALALGSFPPTGSERDTQRQRRGRLALVPLGLTWGLALVLAPSWSAPQQAVPASGPLPDGLAELLPRLAFGAQTGSALQLGLASLLLAVPLLPRWTPRRPTAAWLQAVGGALLAFGLLSVPSGAGPIGGVAACLLAALLLRGGLMGLRAQPSASTSRLAALAPSASAGLLLLAFAGTAASIQVRAQRNQVHVQAHTRSVLAALEERAWSEAQRAVDAQVLVVRHSAEGRAGGSPGLGVDLDLVLAPPFRTGRIPLEFVDGEAGLDARLALLRSRDPELGRRSLVLLRPLALRDWSPGQQHPLELYPGWSGAGQLGSGVLATPEPTSGAPSSVVAWSFRPPLPAHAHGAIELRVPAGGLQGRLSLLGGDLASGPELLHSYDLDLPGAAGQPSVVLASRAVGSLRPLQELRFEGPRPPEQAPRALTQARPPSLLLPGADHVLDLTAELPPVLEAWYPPELLRPVAFRLDLELETSVGLFDLSTGGAVPPGGPGELRLQPTWLQRTDRWLGPSPGSEAQPWRAMLDQGLLHGIRKGGDDGPGRWRLHLYWPDGLEAGSSPWAPISWTTLGSDSEQAP